MARAGDRQQQGARAGHAPSRLSAARPGCKAIGLARSSSGQSRTWRVARASKRSTEGRHRTVPMRLDAWVKTDHRRARAPQEANEILPRCSLADRAEPTSRATSYATL